MDLRPVVGFHRCCWLPSDHRNSHLILLRFFSSFSVMSIVLAEEWLGAYEKKMQSPVAAQT